MTRFFYVTALLILVWSIIGVGYHYTVATIAIGDTTVRELVEREVRKVVPTPALLSSTVGQQQSYDSIILVGDVLLARNVEFLMREHGSDYPHHGLEFSALGSNPAVVANFEAAVPKEHDPTPIGMIDFSVSVDVLPALHQAGYTHLSLANNHSFDYGLEGFVDTTTALADFTLFGHPTEVTVSEPSYFWLEDTKVSLIGINALEPVVEKNIRQVLQRAAVRSDMQIVYVHWGEEYALRHNTNQRQLAELFVSAGADLIVGHHPHVVQGIDVIDGTPVFYSLGNYIFDQYFSKDVQEGLLLAIDHTDGLVINLIPVTSRNVISQPQLMEARDHSLFLSQLARKSDDSIRDDVLTGQIRIGQDYAVTEKVAIMPDIKQYVQ